MSEKMYRLKIKNNEIGSGWNCDGFVGQNVIDKIKNKEAVEFNMLVKYIDKTDSLYQRCHYSPVKDMEVDFVEVTKEEMEGQCLN